ncbi:MAG: hypothetical protein WD075_08430 [Rhodospirillales bacterium]
MNASENHKRAALDPWDIGFGAVVFAGSILAIFVWFPNDMRGGFFHINATGQTEPGDAFFPTLLAATLALLSALQLILSITRGSPPVSAGAQGNLTVSNIKFLTIFTGICIAGLLIMYTLGPGTAWVMRELGLIDLEYRYLTDTTPYKYLGYVTGGFLMTTTLIIWTEGKLRRVSVFTVLMVITVSILIFDMLLTNVLLPPNADF